MKKIFTDNDKKYMVKNYLLMSYKDIANNLGYDERQIRGWLNNNGYTKLRKINDHYFDNIDNSLKAYFLGYIFADGWIIFNEKNRNYEFGMELQSQDKYILEKLNYELGNKNEIRHNNSCKRIINGNEANIGDMDCLRVFSKNLVLGLIKNGVETNKTQKDIHPDVEEKYFFDWLRGYIDGDGCFYKSRNNYYMHITCSSDVVLKYIKDKLIKYNIETNVYKENDKKYRLSCTTIKEMKKLVTHLYYKDELFCLTRKYEKIKYYLGFAA